jgi:hypothetical protein
MAASTSTSYYTVLDFSVSKVLQPVVGILGVVGNILSLIVFASPKCKMATSIRVYLMTLCCLDLVFLVTSLFESAVEFAEPHHPKIISMLRAYDRQYIQAITKGSRSASCFVVVIISIERFVAVTYPLAASKTCFSRLPGLPIILVVLLNAVFSLFIVLCLDARKTPDGMWTISLTQFAIKNNFLKVYGTVAEVVTQLVPASLVSVFNLVTIVQLAIASNKRKAMSSSDSTSDAQATKMLLGVALLFNVCVLPSFIVGVTYLIRTDWRYTLPVKSCSLVARLLSRLNSSLNIVVYVVASKRFLGVLQDLFRRGRGSDGSTKSSSEPTMSTSTSNNSGI